LFLHKIGLSSTIRTVADFFVHILDVRFPRVVFRAINTNSTYSWPKLINWLQIFLKEYNLKSADQLRDAKNEPFNPKKNQNSPDALIEELWWF